MAASRSRREVAERFGVSQSYVSQVIKEHKEQTSAEQGAAMQDVRLEYIQEKQFEILRAPLQVKVSASGKPVYLPDMDDPSGRTPDYSKPVYDYAPWNEASKVLISAMDRQSKLNAYDAVKPKGPNDDDQRVEWVGYTEQLLAERKEIQDQALEREAEFRELEAKLRELAPYAPHQDTVEAEVISPGEPGT